MGAIVLIGLAKVWRKPLIYMLAGAILLGLLGGIIAHVIGPLA